MYDDAMALDRRVFADDAELLQNLNQGFAKAGPRGAMRAVADTLAARYEPDGGHSLSIAEYYAMAGEVDSAFAWLGRAYQERRPILAHLRAQPEFDSLRSDPRFADLLRRMNFPK